jgi:hypothetical protein
VRVRVHHPACERRVRAGQLALHRVLGQDRHRLLAERSVPGELLRLWRKNSKVDDICIVETYLQF